MEHLPYHTYGASLVHEHATAAHAWRAATTGTPHTHHSRTLACSTVRVQFASAKHAGVAVAALEVDPELQPDKAFKFYAVEGSTVVVYVLLNVPRQACRVGSATNIPTANPPTVCSNFYATEARVLRVMVSTVFDMLAVTARMLREFS